MYLLIKLGELLEKSILKKQFRSALLGQNDKYKQENYRKKIYD